MEIIDPGHIYKISNQTLIFVKRSGGTITHQQEWAGIQTQAVMRALIIHLEEIKYLDRYDGEEAYFLWQLGSDESQPLLLGNAKQVREVIEVLIDRSRYLNAILNCIETQDAIAWLEKTNEDLRHHRIDVDNIRRALWCYEARAWRRKQEKVNRELPAHDDSARPRPWRDRVCDDVPFSVDDIDSLPTGDDGHVIVAKELCDASA